MNQTSCVEIPVTRKRGRLRQACNACSRVKKKCDGGNPCSFCTKSKSVCVYEERNRPGPPPKKCLVERGHSTDSQPTHKQSAPDSIITTDELNFITIFMQNVHGNIPLASQQIINDGVSRIASMNATSISNVTDSKIKYTSIDNDALISLAWSVCCYGAYLAQDNRSDIYLANAHKALLKCFDGASILVVKAFFALELLLQLYSENSSPCPLLSRKGAFFELGQTILFLPNMVKDPDCELLWNFLRLWKNPPNLIGATLPEFWNQRFPRLPMTANDDPVKHSHVMLHYWTSRLSEDNYQATINITSSDPEKMKALRELKIESHINGILQDIRQIKILEDTCLTQETNPATTVVLHFSLAMHRLKLHQYEGAFHGLKSVAAYFWMHPFVISTPHMWKVVYMTRMVLLNSELTHIVMQSSLRPLADDLFALLCHTGKLFGFNDVYSSNSSPVLSNIRKNVMTVMFSASHHIAETVAAYALAGSNIGNNTVTVLTMNGWLRLAQGEISTPGTAQNIDNSNRLPGQPQPNPQPSKPSRLSSMVVPSSFIDKRICLPEKPILASVESRVAAASQYLGTRNHQRQIELSRDALIALERTSSGRTTSDCTSSWDTSTGDENDEDDDGKAGSSYGHKKRNGSLTSSKKRGEGSRVSGGRTSQPTSRPGSQHGRSREGSLKSVPKCQPLSLPIENVSQSYQYDSVRYADNGMDELLMQMMNPEFNSTYNFAAYKDDETKKSTDNLSIISDRSDPLGDKSNAVALSEKAVPAHMIDEQIDRAMSLRNSPTLTRNASDLSISVVMDNLDTWIADLNANNMSYT